MNSTANWSAGDTDTSATQMTVRHEGAKEDS